MSSPSFSRVVLKPGKCVNAPENGMFLTERLGGANRSCLALERLVHCNVKRLIVGPVYASVEGSLA